jgi:replication factor C subunit 2/4
VVSALTSCLQKGTLPHLLFHGPPGTGKTSAILAIAKQLFGPELYRTRVLELNASDERGIQVVREKIKKFAQVAVTKNPEYPCPSFKIIILDEADSLTNDAQSALRRVIEKYTKVTRFCLICNYISKIIDPVASRCVKFRFKPISDSTHLDRLKFICESENINCTDTAFHSMVRLADGDLRKSINTLQSAARLYGDFLTDEMVLEVAGVVSDSVIDEIVVGCTADYAAIQSLVERLLLDGYQPDALIYQYFDKILAQDTLSEIKKAKVIEVLAETDFSLTNGGNENLQLLKAFSSIQEVLTN